MDTRPDSKHSSAWIFQVWASFVLSLGLTAAGVIYSPVGIWIKGFLGMGLLFTVGSTISLSKAVRDLHESDKLLAKVDEAKLQKFLADTEVSEIE